MSANMKRLLFTYLDRWTSLSLEEQGALVEELRAEAYPKGTVLLRQGDVPAQCYFVLQGCVRQYAVDVDGREITSNFYTEEMAIAVFSHHKSDCSSDYTFTCVEDSVLVVGDLAAEQDMYGKYAQLEAMTRKMVEEHFGQMQAEFAAFIGASPEERFKRLLARRPGLIDRVPQHQLASYLGMTPESLSRIKRRLLKDR